MHRTVALVAAFALAAPATMPDRTAPGTAQGSELAWGAATVIARGGGEKGPWRQNASRYDYVDDGALAHGADGSLYVAWADQGRKDVFFKKVIDGEARAPAQNVSRSPATFSWLPRIAVAPGKPDRVYLLWQEIIFSGGSHGGDILFARSDDGGASFSRPLNLSRSQGGDGKGRLDHATWSNGSYDLALAPDGGLLAAWTEYDGALWFARSLDGGASFSAPVKVAGDDARPARAPSIAAGAGGSVYLAWTVGEDLAADIRVAHSGDGGARFGTATLVGAGPGHADAPSLALDRAGALHLVYAERPAERGAEREAAYAVRYVRSPGGVHRFGAARTISQPVAQRVAPRGAGAAYPRIRTDGGAGLYVLWEVFPAGASRPHGLGLTWSGDAGEHFAGPVRVPGSGDPDGGGNGSHQGLLGQKLAVDAHGRLAVINSSLVPGKHSRVWLIAARALRQRKAHAPD